MDEFVCIDCSVNTAEIGEYYMVQNYLWWMAGMEPDGGMLCIGCLEYRLNRRLRPADFTDAFVNYETRRHSDRLHSRLQCQEIRIKNTT